MKRFLLIGLCLSLIGCADTSNLIRKPFAPPEYGETRQQLIEQLGKPDSIEIYQKFNQQRVEFYMYVKDYESPGEKVPVCLIDNKVVGWGKTYYADHVSTQDIRLK